MIERLVIRTKRFYDIAINSDNSDGVFYAAMVVRLCNSFKTLYVSGVISNEVFDTYNSKMFTMCLEIKEKYTKEEMKDYL